MYYFRTFAFLINTPVALNIHCKYFAYEAKGLKLFHNLDPTGI